LKKRRRRKPVQNVLPLASETLVVAEVPVVVTVAQQVEEDAEVAVLHPLLQEVPNGLLPLKARMALNSFGPTT
jgi:hypothetical protein